MTKRKPTSRIDIIGQNGNDGLHYDQIPDIDDVIATQAWYDALNIEDEEDYDETNN